MSLTFEDAMYVLGQAHDAGAIQVRYAPTRGRCRSCAESVQLVQMKLPMLTSSGRTYVWQTAWPEIHRRACHEAEQERIDVDAEEHPVDLWAGTGELI